MNINRIDGFNEAIINCHKTLEEVISSKQKKQHVSLLSWVGFKGKEEKTPNQKIMESANKTIQLLRAYNFHDEPSSKELEKSLHKIAVLKKDIEILIKNKDHPISLDSLYKQLNEKYDIVQNKLLSPYIHQLQQREIKESLSYENLKKMENELEELQKSFSPEKFKTLQKKIQIYLDVIRNRLEDLSTDVKDFMSKEEIEKLVRRESILREQIAGIRRTAERDIKTFDLHVDNAPASANEIARKISTGIRTELRSLYEEGIEALKSIYGDPPCDFSLVFFGSLARNESGPYPDIDHLLLIEKKTEESEKYFTMLNQFVADHIWRLGESRQLGKPGLRFCYGGMNPPYQPYISRYSEEPNSSQKILDSLEMGLNDLTRKQAILSDKLMQVDVEGKIQKEKELEKEEFENQELQAKIETTKSDIDFLKKMMEGNIGTEYLLAEPASFARFQLRKLPKGSPSEEVSMVSKISSLVDYDCLEGIGNPQLFKEMKKIREEELNKILLGSTKQRQIVVRNNLTELFKWLKEATTITEGKLGIICDTKADLYRFPQIVIANLAIYYEIKETNTIERIKALQDKGVFQKEFAQELMTAVDFCLKLRIKTQLFYREEFEYFSTVPIEDLKEDYEKRGQVLKELQNRKQAEEVEISQLEERLLQKGDDLMAQMEAAESSQKILKLISQKREDIIQLKEQIHTVQVNLKDLKKLLDHSESPLVLSQEELNHLEKQVLPTLHQLYQMTQKSLRGKSFSPEAFSK